MYFAGAYERAMKIQGSALLLAMLLSFSAGSLKAQSPASPPQKDWTRIPFVESKDNKGWQKSDYGRDGEIEWKNDLLVIHRGKPMTGINWKGEFPKDQFEVRLEARRTEGDDFFVGLTVPVGDGHTSLILGGWSGAISGLSSIDGSDASENSTSFYREFKNGVWYKVRLVVKSDAVQAFVNDEQVIDQPREDHTFTLRLEIDPSLPMGLATYSSTAEIKNFEYRRLDGAK